MFTLESLNLLPVSGFVDAARRRFRACALGGRGRGRQAPLPDRRRPACGDAGRGDSEPRRAAARLHPGPSGTRLQGEARRPDRGFAGRTGRARARPAERGGVCHASRRSTPPIGTNSASPSLSACAGTPGIRSCASSSGGSATTRRPNGKAALDEIGLITRLRLVGKVDGPGKPKTEGRLSTHVLDNVAGKPAQGVAISFYEIGDSARSLLAQGVTNADGRTDAPLIGGGPLRIGTYELQFHVADYFAVERHRAVRSRLSRRRADPLFDRRAGRALSCAVAGDALELRDLSRELTCVSFLMLPAAALTVHAARGAGRLRNS